MFFKRKQEKNTQPEEAKDTKQEQSATETQQPLKAEKHDERKGLLGRLRSRLSKTKEGLVGRIRNVIRLRGKFDDELLEEIEEILIQADLGVETTMKIIERVKEEGGRKELKDPESIMRLFKDTLFSIMKDSEGALILEPHQKPYIILVVGVNGVGKTTTIAKLAQKFKGHGKSVMLVAGDTFRAAAIEQLSIWAQRTGSDIIRQTMGSDSASVCFDALQAAQKRGTDIVIIDTAGRLHTKVNLMAELEKIVRVIKKNISDAPHETLLVLDATTGQNAISQTKIFKQAVDVTGIVITKLDGTAKGGVIVGICDQFNLPVKLIGVGETADDLRPFSAQEFVDALFVENGTESQPEA